MGRSSSLSYLELLFILITIILILQKKKQQQIQAISISSTMPFFSLSKRRKTILLCTGTTTTQKQQEEEKLNLDNNIKQEDDSLLIASTEITNNDDDDNDDEETTTATNKKNILIQLSTYIKDSLIRFKDGTVELYTNYQKCNTIRKKEKLFQDQYNTTTTENKKRGITYKEYNFLQKQKLDRSKLVNILFLLFFAPNFLPYSIMFFPDTLPSPFHPSSSNNKNNDNNDNNDNNNDNDNDMLSILLSSRKRKQQIS